MDNLFNEVCPQCGITFSFANNSTITVDTNICNSERVAEKLDMILNMIETFLTRNNLKLNLDKTVIMRNNTRQQIAANGPEILFLQAKDKKGENFKPSNDAKILGVTVNKNLSWNSHLNYGKESVVSKCKNKLKNMGPCPN